MMQETIEPVLTGHAKAKAKREHKAAMVIETDYRAAMRVLEREPGFVGLDLETTGLHHTTDNIAVVAMYGRETNTAAIIHVRGQGLPKDLKHWLGSPERRFITHNGTGFDYGFLMAEGVAWRQPTYFDTLIGEQVALTTGRKDVRVNLKDTLARRLGVAIPKDVDHSTWMLPELDAGQLQYLADDIYYLPLLRESQLERAAEQDAKWQIDGEPGVRDAMAFEQALAPIVASMMMRGLPIDLEALHGYIAKQEAELPEHEAWLRSRLGDDFSLGHGPSVRDRANKVFDLDLSDTRADTLKLLADDAKSPAACETEAQEFAFRLLRYRHGTKRESMYDERFEAKYVRAGRLYGTFRQVGTDTGRFSSWNPNLQQLPRDMRYVISDPAGRESIVAADYSAIEVAIAADLYQDQELLKAVASEDMHSAVAGMLFGERFLSLEPDDPQRKELRRIAKEGSFTLTFGGGFRTLYNKARTNGSKMSYAEIEAAGRAFLMRFQGVERARQAAYMKADQARPVAIKQPSGLRRVLVPGPELKGTTLLNNAVQGCAAYGLKRALFEMDAAGIAEYLSAVVHDEIVTTPPTSMAEDVARELERCMVTGMREATDAPVRVDAKGGRTWQ
jgi:DNA polymerase-1